ncbi:MAG: DUF3179 domain-containing (seleno)protein [Ferruginibacter sp.]
MKRTLLLIFALLFLFATEILRVYFIMPFPGSQKANTIDIAYFISKYIWWLRLIGLILLLSLSWRVLRYGKWWKKILLSIFVLLYATVFYFFNFKFLADKMFIQPQHKMLATVAENKIDSAKLIIGVTINGQSKAYPIEIIGYHHQVQDTLDGQPIMVTYCTVCRTGRVFSPFVNRKFQQFRLVGMDHFNAMFEDADTKSWWRQATGVAIVGPLKGQALKEIPSEQMRLGGWIQKHPNTLILQPDTLFAKQYKGLQGFDDGTIKSGLEKRDSGSWQFKSWVVGVQKDGHAKAYDWNELVKQRIIHDTFQNIAIVLVLENDNNSFHVWSRQVNDKSLYFRPGATAQTITDTITHSTWNMNGECIEGTLKGSRLPSIQSYQEFWHSWQTFHPGTTKYMAGKN